MYKRYELYSSRNLRDRVELNTNNIKDLNGRLEFIEGISGTINPSKVVKSLYDAENDMYIDTFSDKFIVNEGKIDINIPDPTSKVDSEFMGTDRKSSIYYTPDGALILMSEALDASGSVFLSFLGNQINLKDLAEPTKQYVPLTSNSIIPKHYVDDNFTSTSVFSALEADVDMNRTDIATLRSDVDVLRTDVDTNELRLTEVENVNASQQENLNVLNQTLVSAFEFNYDLTPSTLIEGAFTPITVVPAFTLLEPTILKVAINAKITNTNTTKKYTLRITNGGTVEGVDYFDWDVEQLQDTQNIGAIWEPPEIPVGTYTIQYFVEVGAGTATLIKGNIRIDNKGTATSIDLSGYVTQTQLTNTLTNYATNDYVDNLTNEIDLPFTIEGTSYVLPESALNFNKIKVYHTTSTGSFGFVDEFSMPLSGASFGVETDKVRYILTISGNAGYTFDLNWLDTTKFIYDNTNIITKIVGIGRR